MKLWFVYRIDRPDDRYEVWTPTRDAAIRCAHIEHFGVVLLARMLGASR